MDVGSEAKANKRKTRNDDATVFVGNLHPRVTEELLWELMLQVGPIVRLHIAHTPGKRSYAFAEYQNTASVVYACKVSYSASNHMPFFPAC